MKCRDPALPLTEVDARLYKQLLAALDENSRDKPWQWPIWKCSLRPLPAQLYVLVPWCPVQNPCPRPRPRPRPVLTDTGSEGHRRRWNYKPRHGCGSVCVGARLCQGFLTKASEGCLHASP